MKQKECKYRYYPLPALCTDNAILQTGSSQICQKQHIFSITTQ